MTRAFVRVSLVVFLTVALSYQSWSISVPSDNTDFRFTTVHAVKLIPSLFDIDDEHRGGHAALSPGPAVLATNHPSILLTQSHGYFRSDFRCNYGTLHKSTVVLLI
jgi:hypothetical protein